MWYWSSGDWNQSSRNALWVAKEAYITVFVARRIVILGRHLVCNWIFSFFFENLFLSLTFFQPTRVGAFEFCSLVGWAIQSLIHGSYPDFLPTFSPTGVFSGRVFSGLRLRVHLSLSSVFCFIPNTKILYYRLQYNVSLQVLVLGLNRYKKPYSFLLLLCTWWS